MSENLISLVSVAKEMGAYPNRFITRARKRFPSVVRKARLKNQGHVVWAIPEVEKLTVVRELGFILPTEATPNHTDLTPIKESWERKCAEQLERQGYTTIITDKPGTPDVIGFRKRPDGGFDLAIREAKGPGDTLTKEQFESIERLKSEGVDAGVQWF